MPEVRSQSQTWAARTRRRCGMIAVQLAISMVPLCGVVAFAIDGGMLIEFRRRVQAAADAAALAAAADLFVRYTTNNGLDPNGTAASSASLNATANGFSANSSLTVNIPPKSGPYTGKSGYAEVILTYQMSRGFSSIFGSGAIPVTARAVAKGIPGNIGLLILDPHLMDSCEIDGNINILNGGQIFSNSDNTVTNDSPLTGSVYVASTSTLSTGGINVRGSLVNNGSVTYTNGGGLKYYSTVLADPLANIPEPTTSGLINRGSVTLTTDTTINPGIYTDITINQPAVKKGQTATPPTITMQPGIYYLANGGSLQLNAGTLQGTGVMIFDNTGGDKILNTAGGPVSLTPPTPSTGGVWPTGTTSSTYSGISFWIPRSQTKEVHIESTCNLTMPGTFYAQGGEFDFRPDGATTVYNTGNYICDQAEWGQGYSSSKSNGIININPTSSVPTMRPGLVE